MSAKYKAIDLFAGIGGIRKGFENAFKSNVEFVFSSEIDKFARKTYEANFQEIPHGDITEIESKDIPSHDILLGGFPCQPFSSVGLKKGFNDTRGTLFFEVTRIIKHHKPSVLFLENVKGLVYHDKSKTLSVIIEVLKDLGYNVFWSILNAKNFGVPQNRARVYIVAFLNHDVDFKFPVGVGGAVKLGDILEDNVDDKHTISDRSWRGCKSRKLINKAKGNGFIYGLYNHDTPYVSTILASYGKDKTRIMVEQPGKNHRGITPREAARLQGFSDDFKITVSATQAYKQFGNSVTIPVIEAVAINILKAIKGK